MLTWPLSAKTGCEQSQQSSPLFDHLVGEREQPIRHIEAERLGGLEVEHKLELGRLHHRQVRGLLAFENAARMVSWSEGRLF